MLRRTAIPALALASTLGATTAFAQSVQPYVDSQTFRIAPGAYNFLVTAGARTEGNMSPSFGAFVDYANSPVRILNAECPHQNDLAGCMPTSVRSTPIRHLASLDLFGTITLFRRLQIGLNVPVAFEQGDNVDPTTLAPASTSHDQVGGGIGDPRLEIKVRVVGEGLRGPAFAVAAFGQIPLARWTAPSVYFMGDYSAVFGARLIGEYRVGSFAVAANAGVAIRPQAINIGSDTVSHRILWSFAASYDFTPRITGLVDYFGGTDLLTPFTVHNDSEPVFRTPRFAPPSPTTDQLRRV